MMTGLDSRETDVRAMEAGAADFLDKGHLSTRLLERSIRYAIGHRHVEDALAAERNLLRTLIDSIPDYIFVKDTQSRFVMVNNTVLWGSELKDKEEFTGKTDFDFFSAEIAQSFYDDEQHVMTTGQAVLGKEEASVHLLTGEQIWFSTTKVPLTDSHGNIIGLIGISRDITEHKRAVDDLREQEEKLRTIFDVLPVGVSVMDNDRQIAQMNHALEKILDITLHDFNIGKYSSRKYVHSDGTEMPPSELPSVTALTEQRAVLEVEIGVVKEDGATVWASVSAAPLPLNQGAVIVTADITERKMAEKRAFELSIEREKVHMLTSFIEYSSHDFRTPLSRMAMALHIARQTNDEEKRQEKFDSIQSNIMSMTGIIEEIQLLTRLESGLPIHVSPISLDNIIQGIPNHIQRLINEKGLSVNVSPENHIFIMGDAELLRQAYFRLLHNAVLYTTQSGSITVHTRLEDSWGVIDVVDTGMGIESAKLQEIFDHFTKVNTARTTDGSGAGLGLAIVKKVIEVHHGKITVTSNPGQGSSFCLMLPLADITASS
jgi:two-component system, sensor histidine kinase and response regulator